MAAISTSSITGLDTFHPFSRPTSWTSRNLSRKFVLSSSSIVTSLSKSHLLSSTNSTRGTSSHPSFYMVRRWPGKLRIQCRSISDVKYLRKPSFANRCDVPSSRFSSTYTKNTSTSARTGRSISRSHLITSPHRIYLVGPRIIPVYHSCPLKTSCRLCYIDFTALQKTKYSARWNNAYILIWSGSNKPWSWRSIRIQNNIDAPSEATCAHLTKHTSRKTTKLSSSIRIVEGHAQSHSGTFSVYHKIIGMVTVITTHMVVSRHLRPQPRLYNDFVVPPATEALQNYATLWILCSIQQCIVAPLTLTRARVTDLHGTNVIWSTVSRNTKASSRSPHLCSLYSHPLSHSSPSGKQTAVLHI